MIRQGFSYSELETWQRCPRQWAYKYKQRLQRKDRWDRAVLGTLVHLAVAAIFKGENWEETLEHWQDENSGLSFDGEIVQGSDSGAQELVERTCSIVSNLEAIGAFNDWEALEDRDGKPLVEYDLRMPLNKVEKEKTGRSYYKGRLDLLAQNTKDGLNWLLDFKTRSSFTADEESEIGLQPSIYSYTVERTIKKVGIDIAGSVVFELHNQGPRRPKVNQKGAKGKRVSRQKIRSSWPIYCEVLAEEGENPGGYQDMKNHFSKVEWYRLHKTYRAPGEGKKVWQQVIVPLAATVGRKPIGLRHLGDHCSWCPFRDLCFGKIRLHDIDQLMTGFEIRG